MRSVSVQNASSPKVSNRKIARPSSAVGFATAGGVLEYAKEDRIVVMRTENGRTVSRRFNYKQVSEGKNLQQNIELKPGDTIVVP